MASVEGSCRNAEACLCAGQCEALRNVIWICIPLARHATGTFAGKHTRSGAALVHSILVKQPVEDTRASVGCDTADIQEIRTLRSVVVFVILTVLVEDVHRRLCKKYLRHPVSLKYNCICIYAAVISRLFR